MDSGSIVLARLSSDPRSRDDDASPWLRALWATLLGLLTLAMLFVDGIPTLQQATIVMGLPFTFVMVGIMISTWRALRTKTTAWVDPGDRGSHAS